MGTIGSRILKKQLFGLVSLFFCGCASSSFDVDLPHDEQATPQTAVYVDTQVKQQLTQLEKNLKDFSMFFAQQDKDLKLPNRETLKTENVTLNRFVHIESACPIEQLLSELAHLTGFHAQVIGSAPVLPVLVSLHHEKIKIIDVIRDAALQVHQKADLIVFPDERLIELRYR